MNGIEKSIIGVSLVLFSLALAGVGYYLYI
jgi:hypothetical protein